MKKGLIGLILFVIFSLVVSAAGPGFTSEKESPGLAPGTKPDGSWWRLGYLEGGPYFEYQLTLRAIVLSMAKLGWMVEKPLPLLKDKDDTRELWEWLTQNAESQYIEFVRDAYWSADWDEPLRKSIQQRVLRRLNEVKDIDLMIAMGTWAGLDLANNSHSVPTLVMASTDPIRAGIIKSARDSGYQHLHARVDPTRYERQVRIFHDLIGFNRLGIAYEDTVAGRSYSAVKDVEKVAAERGFKIVRCHSMAHVSDIQIAYHSLVECHKKLAPGIAAMYLTIQRGMDIKNLHRLMEPLNKYRIPTFSQFGSEEVKHGVLMSIAQAGFKYVGSFYAQTIAKVLRGAKPGDLSQVFEDPPKIALNLEEARIIQWDPPMDVLSAADEIYEKIEQAERALEP
jgi:ABC-type uncharacterized transport system substrate-binding protein